MRKNDDVISVRIVILVIAGHAGVPEADCPL